MNLSAMKRFRGDDVVDAVVVGTGAGGAPILARLARAGLRVVALEAGRNRVNADFVADEIGASDIYWLGERISAGMPEAFGANNSGIGVGGSTLHWGAFTPRPDARDLALRSSTGAGVDWPFGLPELTPFLERVEAEIGVSGPNPYPWDPARRYRMAPVALNGPAQAMQRGCAALGIRTAPAPAAVLTEDRVAPDGTVRHACINCGHCHQGCRVGAKASTDITYLPWAVADGAEIRDGCMVNGIERDAAGRVVAVLYRRDGVDHRQRCAALFLCAGAVETPRLLLHCGINGNGQVGRNYMAHPATQVWGRFEAAMRGNKGYPSSLITEDMIRPADADFAGGYLVQSLGVLPATLTSGVTRGAEMWGADLMSFVHGYNHLAGIGINGDCLPSEANRLELSEEVDGSGMAKPLVHYAYGPNEAAMDRHAIRTMTAAWEAAGARDIVSVQRAAHTIGTCRMGADRDACVVDAEGRSHEVANLFVCDNSVFPSALPANPALTIMALGLRTADRALAARG